MGSLGLSISIALHGIAAVVLIGQYVVFALVVLPVLESILSAKVRAEAAKNLAGRSRPWVLGSLVVFLATGIHMLLVNPQYLGFMEFGNAWSILMLSKHILVLGLIVLGVYLERGIASRLESAPTVSSPGC